jgi:hypothetical protein
LSYYGCLLEAGYYTRNQNKDNNNNNSNSRFSGRPTVGFCLTYTCWACSQGAHVFSGLPDYMRVPARVLVSVRLCVRVRAEARVRRTGMGCTHAWAWAWVCT